MRGLKLEITGMACGHCQAGVATALKAVPGVVDAHVDFKTAQALVHGTADPPALIEAVIREGYGAQVDRRP